MVVVGVLCDKRRKIDGWLHEHGCGVVMCAVQVHAGIFLHVSGGRSKVNLNL